MKKQIFVLLYMGLTAVFGSISVGAQSFKRQVLGSVGTTHIQVGNVCIASTIGQPPNAGTIGGSPGFCLRQGFQQPSDNFCGLQVSFDVTPQMLPNSCGTSYIFEYTGTSVPGLEVTWSFGTNGSPASYVGLVSPNVTFSQAGVETIMLTLSTGTCSANFSKTVQVLEAPFQVGSTIAPAKCFGDKGSISLVANGPNGPFSFLWDNNSTASALFDLAPGQYGYTVTDAKGCSISTKAEVLGADEPLRVLPKSHAATCETISDGSIDLVVLGGVTPYSYHWNDDSDSTLLVNIKAGTYSVSVTDALGCLVSTGVKVGELCKDPGLPDTFTPNGDGVNDVWEIPDIDRFPNHEVRIFNRWGNIVYSAFGNFNGWYGQNSKDEPLPAAAYFYVVKLNDPTNIVWDGAITIIR